MKTPEVQKLINQLTSDKDEQQELWVYHLERNDVTLLPARLEELRSTSKEVELLQVDLWKRTSHRHVRSLDIGDFSQLEQSVMHLLALGATISEISGIKRLHASKVEHVISVIREHPYWTD
jgi:hypothetical protein